ncbi:MAG: DUF1995 family protein [Gomphosphaeria aponina SAG 52.96 = DSM 107014]|uniref:DUF1995 family protein n=1 Tax=Gomphosphaeria aponina SAG 52.96 = DSM 107014 TaxID=1521640 RepID=A0A941GMQ1_9CHRO|nr:DUF1995 family protein [Gomphosphaeria aponina SAG 52.96 = DSM 107014]
MVTVPTSLEETLAQAKTATLGALNDGYKRVQVELVIPEIALKAMNIAWEFTPLFQEYGSGLKVLFPDTGAAALARREWGEILFKISDLGSSRTPVEMKVNDEDRAFLVVCPSAVEVGQVEKLCNIAGERPVVLLIPQLEDVSIVGIGYAARELRKRFLSTLESCYYFRPLEGAVVLRSYPSLWQVWLEKEDEYELRAEESEKPMGEALERILNKQSSSKEEGNVGPTPKKTSLLGNLQKFLRALSQ